MPSQTAVLMATAAAVALSLGTATSCTFPFAVTTAADALRTDVLSEEPPRLRMQKKVEHRPLPTDTLKEDAASIPPFNYKWSLINYDGRNGIDGFSSIYKLNECVVLLGKRSATPNFQMARADVCRSPPNVSTGVIQWDIIGGIVGYSGAHTYYYGSSSDAYSDNNTVLSSTGDTGNPCIMRSTDQGKTWAVVKSYKGAAYPAAVFSPTYMRAKGQWAAFYRNDPTNHYVVRSEDDGVTWTVQTNTTGLAVGPRRVQPFGDKLYYSGVFGSSAAAAGLYTTPYIDGDAAGSAVAFTGILTGKPIFAGVTVTSKGTVIAGEYASGPRPVYVNLYRKDTTATAFTKVLSGTAASSLIYFREIKEVIPGVLLAFLSCSENSQDDKDMQVYKSLDDGLTWALEPKVVFTVPSATGGTTTTGVNAVYGTVVMQDIITNKKYLLAAAQPNNMVLRLDWEQ